MPARNLRRRNTGCARRKRHDSFGECLQVSVDMGPVEPGDGVVLAVGVVVALLGAAQLVAAEQQRARRRTRAAS